MKKTTPNDNRVIDKVGIFSIRWLLLLYDFIIFAVIVGLLLVLPLALEGFNELQIVYNVLALFVPLFVLRWAFGIYSRLWRYGEVKNYIQLVLTDGLAIAVCFLLMLVLPIEKINPFIALACSFMVLTYTVSIRMIYRYVYKNSFRSTKTAVWLRKVLKVLAGYKGKTSTVNQSRKINVAIVGAGRVGTSLAEELLLSEYSIYYPVCFIDVNTDKIGRKILNIPVLKEDNLLCEKLKALAVQEIVLSTPRMQLERKKKLFDYYRNLGYEIKVYDYPTIETTENGKRHLREFSIEELLLRKSLTVMDEHTRSYYKDKVVMITGGGGSIGSELCRQIAKMQPSKLVILDVYENGAYDVQQELKMKYGNSLEIEMEILSVTNFSALERAFASHKPNVLLHAAAHKHVPMMEKNCIEAVENNVFGTLNTVVLSEKYGVERFLMVSTDKAVNPTNVMGATKRMCEMIVFAHSAKSSKTSFSATRFGNVLGSAGSVVPLFKRQIARGGPITLTDKRIIRYFMTIPEATQLVLKAGAFAKNGQLFVLDMGKPVKILDLAENMILLSGMQPYRDIEIVETGLRPGEKLYEELLIDTKTLTKTEDKQIFIEQERPLTEEQLERKLETLKKVIEGGTDDDMRNALKEVVPTFHAPSEVKENKILTEKNMGKDNLVG